jgi:dipeptide/tripeptide permease
MAAEVPARPGGLADGMLAQFPLIGVDKVLKRTLAGAVIVGVVGSAAAVLLGYPLVAPGLILGLILALLNHRVFQSSALRFTSDEGKVRRKPFAGSVFLRLGVCTAIAVVLLVFVRQVGWGTIGGLAVFQALLLVNAIVALIGYQRSDGSDVSA